MPNWCVNELTIKGPIADVDAFVGTITEVDQIYFDFNKFVEYPEEYKEMDKVAAKAREEWEALPQDARPPYQSLPKDGYNSGGYGWCVRNWGTKWNVGRRIVERTAPKLKSEKLKCVKFAFDTAWSPPLPIVSALGDRFPTLTFTLQYWESGCGFSGKYVVNKSVCTEDTVNNAYRGRRGG